MWIVVLFAIPGLLLIMRGWTRPQRVLFDAAVIPTAKIEDGREVRRRCSRGAERRR
jgi:hypothetical protein